jgi:hypothetical protein
MFPRFLELYTSSALTQMQCPERIYDSHTTLNVRSKEYFTYNTSFIVASTNFQRIHQICQAGPANPTIRE